MDDLQSQEEAFYEYFDEDFSQWDIETLQELYKDLSVFLDENFDKLDRRASIDLNDTLTQLEYYLEDRDCL